MVDILSKISTHRRAIAQAIVTLGSQNSIDAIVNKKVPKGDVIEMSKTAGLFAVKKTSDVIPDCHPLPIEYTKITHEIKDLQIIIKVEVHSIYKTGVELEAMYGASVTAMTIYDMLKPIDNGISIDKICLLEKEGGKSDYRSISGKGLRAAVLLISSTVASGKKEDSAGQFLLTVLKKNEFENIHYEILKDNSDELITKTKELAEKVDLLIICGGTGFSKNDTTPEKIKPLLDIEIPGIMEYARKYGQERTPYAMFSRSFAGLIKQTLVLAIPSSTKGVKESTDALFPSVLHSFKMIKHKES